MRTIIKGKNIHISNELKKKVLLKLDKIARHKHDINIKELEVEFSIEKNPSIQNNKLVEITAFTKGSVIRSKKASTDMTASVDLAIGKLDRQIEKYKGKLYKNKNSNHSPKNKEA